MPSAVFEHLTAADGLSHSWVWSIYQDSMGFLWFGTPDGLDRYDGYTFKVYEHDPADPGSLSHNEVLSMCEGPQGYLWIGTRGGGLDRFDRAEDRFTHFRHDPADPHSISDNLVWGLAVDAAGELWIATRMGLNRYDRGTGGFVRYRHDPADPGSLADDLVSSMYEDRSGRLWLATAGGLDRLDHERTSIVHYRADPDGVHGLSHSRVNDVHGDAEGFLWVGTADGLDRWDPRTDTFRHFRHDPEDSGSLSANEVIDLLVDSSGDLWVATRNSGLNRWNRATGAFVHYRHDPAEPRSLSHDNVTYMYEDRNRILWMGSYNGINKYDRTREQFKVYRRGSDVERSLGGNSIAALYEDSRETLWIGTLDAGLDRIDRDRRTVVHYRADPEDPYSLPHDAVYRIFEDREGKVWVGTGGGGLAGFDRASGRFTTYGRDLEDRQSLTSDYVSEIFEDSSGRMWVGTPQGLALFDRERGSFQRFPERGDGTSGFGLAWCKTILEDRSGVLWFGTNSQGLYRLDPGAESPVAFRLQAGGESGLASDSVDALFESSTGTLWVGTVGGGLTGVEPDRRSFVHYLAGDGLPSNIVRAVLEDGEGRLWISTSRGLSRFDPRSRTFDNFDVDDGLASDEFFLESAVLAAGGEMIFGTDGGLTAFRPEAIVRDTRVPPIVVTEMRLFNERVPPRRIDPASPLEKSILATDEIVLSYLQNAFAFEFASLDYASPRKNRYAYRLDGFDRTWIGTDAANRSARYTNLDPGTYVFHVKGSNHHGAWNEEGAAVRIVIRPPPWRSPWAYALYVVLAAALVSAAAATNRRKVAREREAGARRQRELAILVEQKTAELERAMADLKAKNAELEGFAYTVSHDLKSPLMTIMGFIGLLQRDLAAGRLDRLEDDAQRVESGAKKMSRLLSELLELSRIGRMVNPPKSVPFGDLVREAVDLVSGQIAERGVDIEVADGLPEVSGDRVRLVEMIQNLLANAVKFMGGQAAPRIEVGVKTGDSAPVFYVRDNGIGIDARYHTKIFGLFERLAPDVEGTGIGLALVKRIVEVHGGRIWVESAGEGRGSSFCFTLPGAEGENSADTAARHGPEGL